MLGAFQSWLKGLLRLLERVGYARDADREPPIIPLLLPFGALGLIVSVIDPSQISRGLNIALLIGFLGVPLAATLLPPMLSASPTMRTLAWRLRVWARAEPAPLAHARLLGPAGDQLLIRYSQQLAEALEADIRHDQQLAEALEADSGKDPEGTQQLRKDSDFALRVAKMLRQPLHHRKKGSDLATIVAKLLRQAPQQRKKDSDIVLRARRLRKAARQAKEDSDLAPRVAKRLQQAALQHENDSDNALIVARRLQQRGRTDIACRLLQAAAPTSTDAAIALMDLRPNWAPACEALRKLRTTARWRDRRRARRALATHGVPEASGQPAQ
jgi:hypothetical protein